MHLDRLIQRVLLSGLSALGPGCYANCHPKDVDDDFEGTYEVYGFMLRTDDAQGGPIETCEALCEELLRVHGYYEIDEITVRSCSTDVPLPISLDTGAADTAPADTAPADTAPESSAPLGEITCAGHIVGTLHRTCMGRRPLGHRERHAEGSSARGRALADIAHLEAASILAFEELSLWLEQHDAPADLVGRCRSAAEDERLHAQIFGSLARAHGVLPCAPTRDPVRADLLTLALHNAVEGCVYESWAALEARWMALHGEPALRPIFARIAEDETRHGQLAWDLHVWSLRLLSPEQRALVHAALRQALASLTGRARARAGDLGAPSGDVGHTLAAHFEAEISNSLQLEQ